MDIRVLKYFLAVAREGSITGAAEVLHVTQPTLSRQLIDLEQEVGARLLIRGKRQLTLTDAGVLFQQRAKEMILLLEKTQRDLTELTDLVGGVVAIGCVETGAARLLAEVIADFSREHPMVQYELYHGDGDDVREKLDRGNIDLGILLEPVEAAKYDDLHLPCHERWGILMRREDPLAKAESISIREIAGLPLILSRRRIVQDEVASWLGEGGRHPRVFASHNLLTNTLPLVERGLGYAVIVEGAYAIRPGEAFRFVPFFPRRVTGHVLVWKKNRVLPSATRSFIQFLKDHPLFSAGAGEGGLLSPPPP